MFFLTSSFFLVEIVVGHVTNSMALVADSFHMLSDIAALIIAFISVRMSPKSWDKNTYGWARAEVLGKTYFSLMPYSHSLKSVLKKARGWSILSVIYIIPFIYNGPA